MNCYCDHENVRITKLGYTICKDCGEVLGRVIDPETWADQFMVNKEDENNG